MIKLNIRQLETFLCVAECESFRRAAEQLHRSPSAISSHIQQLEEQLGTILLERTTRKMTLTPEGRLFMTRCQGSLRDLDAAAQEITDDALSRRGRVSIGISPSVSWHRLFPIIARHQEQHPELTLEMREAFAKALYDQVLERSTDFAIGPAIEGLSDFVIRPIIKDPIVAVLPPQHRFGHRKSVTLAEIAADIQICMPRGTAIRQVIEDAFRKHGLPFIPKFEVMYPQSLCEMVAAGLGVAMMPLLSVPEVRGFRLAEMSSPRMHREMCLITLKSRKLSPAAKKVVALIVQALKDVPAADKSGTATSPER